MSAVTERFSFALLEVGGADEHIDSDPAAARWRTNILIFYQKLVWTCQTEAQRARKSTVSNGSTSSMFPCSRLQVPQQLLRPLWCDSRGQNRFLSRKRVTMLLISGEEMKTSFRYSCRWETGKWISQGMFPLNLCPKATIQLYNIPWFHVTAIFSSYLHQGGSLTARVCLRAK